VRAKAQKFTKAQKWILVLVYGGLLLGLGRLLLDLMQADWIVRFGDVTYGIKVIKSNMFLVFGSGTVEVSGVIDSAAIVMLAIGVVVAAGVWILRKLRHTAL
jgi:uncharacterized membrane protein YccF (DUF307 family)